MEIKYVYFFGEGDTKDKNLLGGNGVNLGEMTKIRLSNVSCSPFRPSLKDSLIICKRLTLFVNRWPSSTK